MDTRQQHVELFLENGSRRVLTLEQGRDTGMWWLTREGILAPAGPQLEMASLFLRFDGEKLFIGPQPAALLEFRPPSSFETSGIRVAYRLGAPPDDQDDKTSVWVPPPARTTPARTPVAPAAATDWDDATRISPARTFAAARTGTPVPEEEPITAVPVAPPSASNDVTRAAPRSEMRRPPPSVPPPYDEPRTVIAVPMPGARPSDEPRTVIAVPMPGMRPGDDARPSARPSPSARPVEEVRPSPSARAVEEVRPSQSARPAEEPKVSVSVRPADEAKPVATPRPPEAPRPGDGETRIGPPPGASGPQRPVLDARPPFPQRDPNAAPPPSVSVASAEATAPGKVNVGPAFTPFASFLRKTAKAAKPAKAPGDPKDPKKEGSSKPTPIQIAIYALMVAVMGVIAIGVVSGGEPARPPAPKPKPVASASHSGATPAATSTVAARATGASAAPSFASAAAQASPSTPAPTGAPAPTPVSPPAQSAVAKEDAPAPAQAAASAPSLGLRGEVDERSAVLAVESGARDRAASLYDSLAASHPERPVYREAARILRSKAAPTP